MQKVDEVFNPRQVANITDMATGTRDLTQEGLGSLRESGSMSYYNRPGFKTPKGKLQKTDMGWEIFPEGLTHVINKFTKNYSNSIPIYITENGMAHDDTIKKGIINDQERISFYKRHLKEIMNLLKGGVLLKGFFAWSLLDK